MGGKGTETLLNTLFIPNVCKYLPEYRKFGTVQSRNVKSGLPHQGKKPHCF